MVLSLVILDLPASVSIQHDCIELHLWPWLVVR
jgi:hypothetical protein